MKGAINTPNAPRKGSQRAQRAHQETGESNVNRGINVSNVPSKETTKSKLTGGKAKRGKRKI